MAKILKINNSEFATDNFCAVDRCWWPGSSNTQRSLLYHLESFQLGDLVPAADDGVESVRPEGDPDDVWELLDEGDMNDIPQ